MKSSNLTPFNYCNNNPLVLQPTEGQDLKTDYGDHEKWQQKYY